MHETRITHERLRGESFDSEFYKTSARTFNSIYAQADDELRNEDGRVNYQYINKRKVPFGLKQSCDALRYKLSHLQQEDQQTYEGTEDADDTVAIKYRVSTQPKSGTTTSNLLRVINHHYQKDQCVVVVWRSLAEGEGASFGRD
ncbi:hypothetical protein PR003_g10801 [Phytophthora rubi]|uniref:Uncharacterized protein n=1 Tax=Phytophthora rubi TaxID=129364 RepID=A0A6A3M9C0_9STRA|nr:hypothetical protein PR001_g12102 [Phytophthora rubi]KAE9042305.1 hypothetical protein PR002_g3994 [Phytophthora rubi]KAE9339855.1 hypothetical protein PR003_g10801 [Phytophthora rubi]